jgi:hypothetical protein
LELVLVVLVAEQMLGEDVEVLWLAGQKLVGKEE